MRAAIHCQGTRCSAPHARSAGRALLGRPVQDQRWTVPPFGRQRVGPIRYGQPQPLVTIRHLDRTSVVPGRSSLRDLSGAADNAFEGDGTGKSGRLLTLDEPDWRSFVQVLWSRRPVRSSTEPLSAGAESLSRRR